MFSLKVSSTLHSQNLTIFLLLLHKKNLYFLFENHEKFFLTTSSWPGSSKSEIITSSI